MSHASLLGKSPSNGKPYVVEAPGSAPALTGSRVLSRQGQRPFLDRLFRSVARDQREYPRLVAPPLVAYLGNPGSSRPFAIADVSVGGFCMRADEFWSLGTVLTITLQSSQELGDGALDSLTVPAMVVRRAEGAAGFAIALTSEQSLLFPGFRVEEPRNVRDQMKCFLDRITSYGPALPLQIAADAAAPAHSEPRRKTPAFAREREETQAVAGMGFGD